MIILFLGIFFLLLAYIGYKNSHSLFSPYTLVSGAWGVILVAYTISSPNFYPLENRFPIAIFIWVLGFYVTSLFFSSKLKESKYRKQTINTKIWKILIAVSVPTVLYSAYSSINNALKNPEKFFFMLRAIHNGLDENVEGESLGILAYFLASIFILYLAEYIRYPEKKKFFYVLLALNILFAALTVAKAQFVQIFIASFVVLSFKKKIRIKKLIIPTLLIFAFFVLLQNIRSDNDISDIGENSIKGFIDSYVFGGMVAFDHTTFNITWDGRNVFRLFYAIAHVFNKSVPVADIILDYSQIGPQNYTNVYTGLQPFYQDYGMMGIAVFSIVYGALAGFLFAKAKTNSPALIVYSILASHTIMFFMGEYLSASLSLFIQYAFYSYIIYLPSRKNKIQHI